MRAPRAVACFVAALAACRAYPVEFAEPAGARVRLSDGGEAVLPATVAVPSMGPVELELELDGATLVEHGMAAELARDLAARGAARVRGRLVVARGEGGPEPRRFALPGPLVVRAFAERATLRCWWPPETGDELFFEGAPAGEEVGRPARSLQKEVASHTDAQRSSEFAAALSGALIGFGILLIIASASVL